MLTTRQEPLFIEIMKDGKWYGWRDQSKISAALREATLGFLAESPERYYYPPRWAGRLRLSFLEK